VGRAGARSGRHSGKGSCGRCIRPRWSARASPKARNRCDCRAVGERARADGTFHEAELDEIPFGDDSFDVVAGFNAFQFAANPAVELAEARRVTKPGGTIAIVTRGNPQGTQAASLVARCVR
jgi:SAM-dependent methyltransferase